MGLEPGLYTYDAENLEILWYDVVVKRSRSLSHLLMCTCSNFIYIRGAHQVESITMSSCPLQAARLKVMYGIKYK